MSLTGDGKYLAVGTTAPYGDPNVFLLDSEGRIIEQHAVGQRWIEQVYAFGAGPGVAAVCTSPAGDAAEEPVLYRFAAKTERGTPAHDFHPVLFQYGEHSNHYARILDGSAGRLAVATPEGIRWSNANASGAGGVTSYPGHPDPRICAFAANPDGKAVVSVLVAEADRGPSLRNLALVVDGKTTPRWIRPEKDSKDTEPAPPPPAGLYGPHTEIRDEHVWGALSVAISRDGSRVASVDYLGYERFTLPRTAEEKLRPPRSLGPRFMPAPPVIHVYDEEGKLIRTHRPSGGPRWTDVAFTADGKKLLVYPHHWTSRGLAGQPCLPADEVANLLEVVSLEDGKQQNYAFADAISDVATGGSLIAVASWNGVVHLLHVDRDPSQQDAKTVDVGGPSLVRISDDGNALTVAGASGMVRRFDAEGRELWKNDLNTTATHGEKPWVAAKQPGSKIGPGVWRNNMGRAQSDLGNQVIIEAPEGLIMIDPNSGHSFEQNWAAIVAEGLDPMRLKYILPTHEHGDHAPGSYLWRVITGAKVVSSPEMTSTLQHDVPYTTGYGFHPPIPVDVVVDHDQDLDLAGLKVRAVRTPGHTYGSMSWAFELHGRKYVCLGDLIMPDGPLGYVGSPNFWAPDILASLKKLDGLYPDYIICGHANGLPDQFIGAGIRAGEATGWGKMQPPKPDPTFGFEYKNYQAVGWLDQIYTAAFDDIDGDGIVDIATLSAGEIGPVVKIYLNHFGKFNAVPDAMIDVAGLKTGQRIRVNHLTAGKTADLMVADDNAAALLLAEDGKLAWRVLPVDAVRAASFATDRTVNPPEFVIGGRFVKACRYGQLLPNGAVSVIEGPTMAMPAMDLQLRDVNGDGRSDLVTAAGEIFLRDPKGKLPRTASITLERPYGDWTFLAIGDFNGDGRPDIVQLGTGSLHKMAAVFYNTGDPVAPFHLKPDGEIDLGLDLDHIRDGPTVADFDDDGIDDLILGNAQRSDVLILRGSRTNGLTREHNLRVKLDYRVHFDTKLGIFDVNGKNSKSIAGFGYSTVGAGGIYVRMPGAMPATNPAP